MSEMTSIKVSSLVRDRLAKAAKARGVTMRVLLEDLSLSAMDDALMDAAAEKMARLRDSDPHEWAVYVEEGRDWLEGVDDVVEP